MEQGYRISFHCKPPSSFAKNNRPPLAHSLFQLIVSFESDVMPCNVNPFSVSVQSSGKKLLILDFRFIKKHVWKQSIKFEDLQVALNYLDQGHFMFSFYIKSDYHHVEISPPHQSFLGFSWPFKGKTRYFSFRVLPFGLSSVPYIFTKLVRPLISHWRSQGIDIVVYHDDGLGVAPSQPLALAHSNTVRADLVHSGFVPILKSPSGFPPLSWIGWGSPLIFFRGCCLFLGVKLGGPFPMLKQSWKLKCNCATARDLSATAGRINSLNLAVGNATTLMTKFLHMSIVLHPRWVSKFTLPSSVKEELEFWKNNIWFLNGRLVGQCVSGSRTIVYSDASDTGGGGVIHGRDGLICHLPCSAEEMCRSSTWRELRAVHVCLASFSTTLSGCAVQWFTDNRNIPPIIRNGSMKSDLHQLALSIFRLVLRNELRSFRPRVDPPHIIKCLFEIVER